MKIIFSESRK